MFFRKQIFTKHGNIPIIYKRPSRNRTSSHVHNGKSNNEKINERQMDPLIRNATNNGKCEKTSTVKIVTTSIMNGTIISLPSSS